jgi:hypothetical protein
VTNLVGVVYYDLKEGNQWELFEALEKLVKEKIMWIASTHAKQELDRIV